MQLTKEKLAGQQLVLFHLGYYKGNIDGIWSAATIAAKRQFESEPSFLPAYPNNGLPFGERDKLPKGWRYGDKGVIGHSDLTPERTKEILAEHTARIEAAAQRAAIAANKGAQVEEPAKESSVETEDKDEVQETAEPQSTTPSAEEAERLRAAQRQQHQQRHKGNR